VEYPFMLESALILLAGAISFYFKKNIEDDIRLFKKYLEIITIILSILIPIFTKFFGALLPLLVFLYLYKKNNVLLIILLLYSAVLSTYCYLLALAVTILLIWLY